MKNSGMLAALATFAIVTPASAGGDFYLPAGDLVSGSGTGRVDETVYAPGMRFPIENGPAYPNSQVWGVGGSEGPGGSQCDGANYSYPWRDNYCETRSWDMPLCPSGVGHQGQDIRPATCENGVHPLVAAEAGTITNIGSYSVYVTASNGTRFDYLHGNNVSVSQGQGVEKGQQIARVSNAFGGTPTTIHVHFNIRQDVAGVGFVFVSPYMSLVRSYETLMGLGSELPHGPVDAIDCESIRGWALDPDLPDAPVEVQVFFGGPSDSPDAVGVTLLADEHREDLCEALGSCAHGFTLEVPRSLQDGQSHDVFIYAVDDAGGEAPQLEASPGQMQCAPPAIPAGVRRSILSADSLADWSFSPFWDMATVSASDLEGIPIGASWPELRLVVRSETDETLWVIDSGHRRLVTPEVAGSWAIDPATAEVWPEDSVDGVPEGPPLRASKFLVSASGDAIYVIDDGVCLPGVECDEVETSEGSGGGDEAGDDDGGSPGGTGDGDEGDEGYGTDSGPRQGGDDSGCGCHSGRGHGIAGLLSVLLLGLPWIRRRTATVSCDVP
jgi:hypothetical protein